MSYHITTIGLAWYKCNNTSRPRSNIWGKKKSKFEKNKKEKIKRQNRRLSRSLSSLSHDRRNKNVHVKILSEILQFCDAR